MLSGLRWLLSPIAGLYWALTSFRNHLYNIEYKKSLEFTPFLISVGNLSLGGTGKSPMIEYLIKELRHEYKLAVLSRGYRRKTSGFSLATKQDDANTLGDEPYQFYRKFGRDQSNEKVVVAVGEERALAIPEILHHHPEVQLILLDDAFQHRRVKADLQILLTTYQNPFYQDHILPVGLLRESKNGARRADVVIVTKCPDGMKQQDRSEALKKIRQYVGSDTPVYFTKIEYQKPQRISKEKDKMAEPLLLISGIANADLFEAYAKDKFKVVDHIRWGDHHRYTESDFKKVEERMLNSGARSVLTTEKDMVKLVGNPWRRLPLYYLPIGIAFLDQEADFCRYTLEKVLSAEKE